MALSRISKIAAVVFTAALLAGAAAVPSAGASQSFGTTDAPAPEWYRGVGWATVSASDEVTKRVMEAWVSTDGRYVVTTTSVDISASETVIFDGSNQIAVITDPAGDRSVVDGAGPTHFLFSGTEHPGLLANGVVDERGLTRAESDSVAVRVDTRTGLPVHSVTVDSRGPETEIEMSWEPSDGPPGWVWTVPEVDTARSESSGAAVSILATDSNSKTFYSVYGPCVYAYNYRNTGSGYFYASSSARGSCLYMGVSLWKGATTGGSGFCSQEQWLGAGAVSASYSTKGLYTSPANMSPTCSNHAGWLSDWTLVVPYMGLDTAV